MAYVKQDRFKAWNIYHKTLVLLVVAVVVWIIIHAYFSYDGAFRQTRTVTLPYSAETIWPIMTGDNTRDLWYGELIGVSGLNGEEATMGATLLLFWKHRYKRWHAVERVQEVVPYRLFRSIQEADEETRWLKIHLIPKGPCSTEVMIEETTFPTFYKDRFWYFREFERHEKRMDASVEALERWAKKYNTDCPASMEAS